MMWWTPIYVDHAVKPTSFSVIYRWIDAYYKDTYQISLTAGRNLSTQDSEKRRSVVEVTGNVV